MALSENLKEWWTRALLDQQKSAHPVFGDDVHVAVDGDVVTLTGTVERADDVEEIEREARALPSVRAVVNHITVSGADELYHLQTIIATFPNLDAARLACRTVESATFHEGRAPNVLDDAEEAREFLTRRARAARMPEDAVTRYIACLEAGKVLLIDRVPEDDALRVISALEGSSAEDIRTLPPEPAAVVGG